MDWIFCKDRLPDDVCECYVYLPENKERDFEGLVTVMKFYPSVCTVSNYNPNFCPHAKDRDGHCVIDWPTKRHEDGWHSAWVLTVFEDITEEYDIEDVLCWQPVPKHPDPPTEDERRAHE